MNPEDTSTQTTLRLAGDWGAVPTIGLALLLAVAAWFLYFRESRQRPGALAYILPTLRALAILLVALILAGPVLHHEKIIRQLGRLFVLVDGSASMSLADPSMASPRKAAILESMGELDTIPLFRSAISSADALGTATAAARREGIKDHPSLAPAAADFRQAILLATPDIKQICGATLPAQSAAGGEDLNARGKKLLETFQNKIANPSAQLEEETAKHGQARWEDHTSWMRRIADDIDQASEELAQVVEAYGAHLLADPGASGEEFRTKVAELDTTDRWSRLQQLLFREEDGLLKKLSQEQDIELVILGGDRPELAWWQRRAGSQQSGDLPTRFLQVPDAQPSNLAGVLAESLGGKDAFAEGSAAVLFTDGRHNAPGSPQAVAATMGQTGIPLFTVGMGALRPPRDIALVSLDAPQSVFVEDRLFGKATVDDHMDPGLPYRLVVRSGEKELWAKDFQTEGLGPRRFDFDFPIKDLVAGEDGTHGQNIPISLDVSLEYQGENTSDEFLLTNNHKPLLAQAVTRRRHALILDGRPRWETRYIKNHFDRDQQWEATISLSQDRDQDTLPQDRESWLGYDIIFIGDLPADSLSKEERGWLVEFVSRRGGGLILIDGLRGNLEKYADTELAPLLPVSWSSDQRDVLPTSLRPTPENSAAGALSLAAADKEGRGDDEVWANLQPPRWVASIKPHPTAETLAEAQLPDGGAIPAIITQRIGAGRVLYLATDELWRWRYREGDTFHRKFWMQMANWVGEPPFAATGEFVSIASGRLNYEDGDAAQLRVRLRTPEGGPLEGARPTATLWRGDTEFAEIELQEDPDGGGLYRATTSPLPGGEYQVEVGAKNLRDEEVSLTFRVEDPPDQEMDTLTLDRGLLTAMSAASAGGKALLEEDARQLPGLLRSIDRKEVITSETILWSSWWWFLSIIALLTIEWILRKRGGFV